MSMQVSSLIWHPIFFIEAHYNPHSLCKYELCSQTEHLKNHLLCVLFMAFSLDHNVKKKKKENAAFRTKHINSRADTSQVIR